MIYNCSSRSTRRQDDDVGGREPLRRPRTRHDSHTIVASTRARSRSTNLSIYRGARRASKKSKGSRTPGAALSETARADVCTHSVCTSICAVNLHTYACVCCGPCAPC